MRDIFDDIYKHNPLDPEESVRRSMRVDLRKRFYEKASVDESDGAFRVLLDGKPVKTPARRILAAPSRALAQAIADEWDAQKDVIDPGKMPLTRLANSIIDGVADAPGPVAEEIEKYLGSDLLFYRADGPEGLTKRRSGTGTRWSPGPAKISARASSWRKAWCSRRSRRRRSRPRVARSRDNPWALGAVHSVTTLTGSALLALALAAGRARRRCGLGGGACRRGLESGHMGPGRAAMARRALAIRGDAGGGAGAGARRLRLGVIGPVGDPCRARLVQEPHAPLGLVDEILEKARGRDIVVLVADLVGLAHRGDHALIVLAQFGEHIERIDIGRVIVGEPLMARNVADRTQAWCRRPCERAPQSRRWMAKIWSACSSSSRW